MNWRKIEERWWKIFHETLSKSSETLRVFRGQYEKKLGKLKTDFKWKIRRETSSCVIPKILFRPTHPHQISVLVKIMPFFLQQFQTDSHDWKFKMSLLNYVPRMLSWCTCLVTYVLSCPTCFLATSVSCHTCSRASRVLCHTCPLSWRASWHTCSRALRSSCPTFSRASRAPYLICSRTLRVLRTLAPHLSWALRFLLLLVPRAVCALLLLISHLLQVFQT